MRRPAYVAVCQYLMDVFSRGEISREQFNKGLRKARSFYQRDMVCAGQQ